MRFVVKIGTSTLAHPTGLLNIRRVEELCQVLSDLKNCGHQVILVSSGAIGMGVGKLSLKERPKDIPRTVRIDVHLRPLVSKVPSYRSTDPSYRIGFPSR